MELSAECSKCKNKFNLEIDESEEEKKLSQFLKDRFGSRNTILCKNCETK